MNKLFSAAFCGILSLPLLANEAVVSNSAVGWVSHQRLWQDQNSLDFTRLNGGATFGVPNTRYFGSRVRGFLEHSTFDPPNGFSGDADSQLLGMELFLRDQSWASRSVRGRMTAGRSTRDSRGRSSRIEGAAATSKWNGVDGQFATWSRSR